MSDQDAFGDKAETPANVQDIQADPLDTIKNDNGERKYKDVPSALTALLHSQNHIKTLEQEREAERAELARLREVESQSRAVKDVLDQIAGSVTTPAPKTIGEGGISEQKVIELVKSQMEALRKGNLQEDNRAYVNSEIAKLYGEKSKVIEMVKAKATQLNTTPEELGRLAEVNPKLVIGLFKSVVDKQTSPASSTHTLPTNNQDEEGYKPGVSLTRGGLSNKALAQHFNEIKKITNKRLGLE